MKQFEIEKARIDVVASLSDNSFGINLGCGHTSFQNKINVDVAREKRGASLPVDVIASATNLPFREHMFEEIIFQEVLEHIPERFIHNAVSEISKVLKENGRLIITVPNGGMLNKLTDTAWWFGESLPRRFGDFDNRHRHYSIEEIKKLFSKFILEETFTTGRLPWGSQSVWTFNRVTGRDFLKMTIRRAFRNKFGDKGAVLFAILKKSCQS